MDKSHGGAHPRSRGENQIQVLKAHMGDGSSPLTRGKPAGRRSLPTTGRLIPAHAGKTAVSTSRCSRPTAHPRSRGENRESGSGKAYTAGSSPLTRGKRPPTPPTDTHPRLIPAHAGKTRGYLRCAPRREAHPRSRGENRVPTMVASVCRGSSPLTRGKHPGYWFSVFRGRLIPAHAGKTRVVVCRAGQVGAHPRSRGENPAGAGLS